MFERILLALDGSPESEEALPTAFNLARHSQAEVLLVRAQQLPPASFPARLYPWEQQQAEEYLARQANREEASGVKTGGHFLTGAPPAEALLQATRDLACDLVVLTSRGRGGIHRWLLGSVAAKVIRGAHCPVLVVPRALDPKPGFGKILVALDGSELSSWALPAAAHLARQSQGEVVLMTACLPPLSHECPVAEKARQQLDLASQELVQQNLPCRSRIVFGNPAEVILDQAVAERSDLLVLASHGRDPRERFWLGSVAEKVMHHAPCCTLIWKA